MDLLALLVPSLEVLLILSARTVAAANMAAIKIVFFIVKEDMKVYVYLS